MISSEKFKISGLETTLEKIKDDKGIPKTESPKDKFAKDIAKEQNNIIIELLQSEGANVTESSTADEINSEAERLGITIQTILKEHFISAQNSGKGKECKYRFDYEIYLYDKNGNLINNGRIGK